MRGWIRRIAGTGWLAVAACVPMAGGQATSPAGTEAAPAGSADLVAYADGQVSLQVPRGWTVAVEAGVVTAVQRQGRADSPVLWIRLPADAGNVTADQVIDTMVGELSGATVLARESQGVVAAALVDATYNGVAVRVGAIAISAGGQAAVGLLAAPVGEFDAVGGSSLVAAVLASTGIAIPADDGGRAAATPEVAATSGAASGAPAALGGPRDIAWWNDCRQSSGDRFCATLWPLHRSSKRSDRDPLDPGRDAIAARAIVGSWGIGEGSVRKSIVSQTATLETFRFEHSGNAEVFRFDAGGEYEFTKVTELTSGTCRTHAVQTEKGTYRFDGKTLALRPRQAFGVFSICGGAPKRERSRSTLAPRDYELALAPDGFLIMTGPDCNAYDEGTAARECRAGRWDAEPVSR